jgi:hypothetical protein
MTSAAWQRGRIWGLNGLIALLLLLMVLQAWPGVPDWLSYHPQRLADLTGLSQSKWGMFTPEPDNENHRLYAVIEYHDGRRVEWHSPDWPQQSNWSRFWSHRECEYYEQMRTPFFSPALPGFAAWLIKTHRQDPSDVGRAKHIEIHAQYYDLRDPRLGGWRIPAGPPVYDQSTELFSEDYP